MDSRSWDAWLLALLTGLGVGGSPFSVWLVPLLVGLLLLAVVVALGGGAAPSCTIEVVVVEVIVHAAPQVVDGPIVVVVDLPLSWDCIRAVGSKSSGWSKAAQSS